MVILNYMLHHMLIVNISIAIIQTSSNFDDTQKNNIRGVFFWGFLLTPMLGGRLAEIHGTRIVLGGAMLLASLLTLVTPLAYNFNYFCLMVVRFSLGLSLGVAFPAVATLVRRWIPVTDTSKFISHVFASDIGATITLAGSGFLINAWGWSSVFYVTGATVVLWCVCWFYLVYDSPEKHPRISQLEREALAEAIPHVERPNPTKTPWLKMFKSRPVWAIIVANACAMLNTNTTLNYLPLYMRQVLHYEIRENGLLSSLPFLGESLPIFFFFFCESRN